MSNLISIITINYNNKEGIERTIKSITSQTFQEFEYIIIDGGSTDGSREIIEKYSDKISYWISEPDKGIYNAMNKGIVKATGEYLLFINSGDELFENNTIEKSLSNLHTEDIISGNLNFINDKSNGIGYAQEHVTFLQMYRDTIWHPCTFIKKKAFDEVGLYDEKLKICSDWKWFLLAVYKYNKKYKNINTVISNFYLDGISSDKQYQNLIAKEKRSVFEQYFHFSPEDFNSINSLYEDREKKQKLEYKILTIKKSRILKLLYKIGLFKAYKYL